VGYFARQIGEEDDELVIVGLVDRLYVRWFVASQVSFLSRVQQRDSLVPCFFFPFVRVEVSSD
jgi:hypothetical protein